MGTITPRASQLVQRYNNVYTADKPVQNATKKPSSTERRQRQARCLCRPTYCINWRQRRRRANRKVELSDVGKKRSNGKTYALATEKRDHEVLLIRARRVNYPATTSERVALGVLLGCELIHTPRSCPFLFFAQSAHHQQEVHATHPHLPSTCDDEFRSESVPDKHRSGQPYVPEPRCRQ